MNVYRIVRADRTSLDGKGAAEYPGRWNKADVPCVYTSASPSLAQLEVMVNIDEWKIFITVPHVMLRIQVPEAKIIIIREFDLPADWNAAVYSAETQELGTTLLNNPYIHGFSVPSAVSRTERNMVLNPRASNFIRFLKVAEKIPFELDRRLLRKGIRVDRR